MFKLNIWEFKCKNVCFAKQTKKHQPDDMRICIKNKM